MLIDLNIAALNAQLTTSGSELKLLPAGTFRARDGRPANCPGWVVDGAIASKLIAAAKSREVPYVIDYEHQTLNAVANGLPAPAAAWFKNLEWREGDGLYATDVEWTARASTMIEAGEYRFLSPVFTFDNSGAVTGILHAGLTNNPALDCLDSVQNAAACSMAMAVLSADVAASTTEQTEKEKAMDPELLQQLIWMLNLPVGSTEADVRAQLQKLIGMLSGGQGTAAASVDIAATLNSQRDQIASLSANQMDPAKFVPIEVVNDLRSRVAVLTANAEGAEADRLVTDALADGRLLPSMEGWARNLGKSNIVALREFTSAATPIAALTTTQTGGKAPQEQSQQSQGLNAEQLAVCRAMGLSEEAFLAANPAR